jgi:hypothetical protein
VMAGDGSIGKSSSRNRVEEVNGRHVGGQTVRTGDVLRCLALLTEGRC